MNEKANHVLRIYEAMLAVRGMWDSSFTDIANNIYPRKASFNGGFSQGQKVQQRMWDGTAQRAASILASALHTMIAPMTQAWFELGVDDPKLADRWDVKVYLQNVSKIANDIITKSNFHSQFHEHLLDYVIFGNGVMTVEEDEDHVVRFSNRALSECMFDEDFTGRVDKVARVFKLNVRQILQQFDNVHPSIVKDAENENTAEHQYKILHLIQPYEDGGWMKFVSYYVDVQNRHLMYEGGHRDFPYVISRWERASGETYARGPGWHALPEAQQLNVLMKHTARAVQRATDPAIMVPDRLFAAPLNLAPGKINYYRRSGQNNVSQDIQPFPIGAKFDVAAQDKQSLQNAINQAFYVDQLNLPMLDRMTATEVTQRMMSKNYVLSPVLGQLQIDTLERIIKIAFRLADKSQRLPLAPQSLQGRAMLKIKYTSPLSRVQRYNELQGFQQAFQIMTPLIQADPTILKSLDMNAAFRFVMDVNGAPLSFIKSPEQEAAEKMAEQKAAEQQQQQMSAPQALAGLSGSIKDVAQAGKYAAEASALGQGGGSMMAAMQ